MSKLLKRKSILIPSVSICMLAIIAAISTTNITTEDGTANEPAAQTEIVNVNVLKTQIKQPLAITDTDTDDNNTEESDEDKVYDSSMVNIQEDKSIDVNGGELLEDGGAYIELP